MSRRALTHALGPGRAMRLGFQSLPPPQSIAETGNGEEPARRLETGLAGA